jgi:predicted  nucleic acid-binding Zn-ribbon protein
MSWFKSQKEYQDKLREIEKQEKKRKKREKEIEESKKIPEVIVTTEAEQKIQSNVNAMLREIETLEKRKAELKLEITDLEQRIEYLENRLIELRKNPEWLHKNAEEQREQIARDKMYEELKTKFLEWKKRKEAKKLKS